MVLRLLPRMLYQRGIRAILRNSTRDCREAVEISPDQGDAHLLDDHLCCRIHRCVVYQQPLPGFEQCGQPGANSPGASPLNQHGGFSMKRLGQHLFHSLRDPGLIQSRGQPKIATSQKVSARKVTAERIHQRKLLLLCLRERQTLQRERLHVLRLLRPEQTDQTSREYSAQYP